MSLSQRRGHRPTLLLTATALALSSTLLSSPAALASNPDRDGDGMPNRWEVGHGLNPDRANGQGDKDNDRLSNFGEYRHGGHPGDEDSDNDGHDDGDEVRDDDRHTDVDDRDSDDDGVRDGDEDSDDDGTDNEDEDDAREPCRDDDDDRDEDNLSDEDENDYGFRAGDDDSDDDSCSDDSEDADDLLGPIVSFDSETGELVIDAVHVGTLEYVVTDNTEIEYDSSGSGSGWEGSTADLVAGAVVNEIDLEDDSDIVGELEEIELARPTVTD